MNINKDKQKKVCGTIEDAEFLIGLGNGRNTNYKLIGKEVTLTLNRDSNTLIHSFGGAFNGEWDVHWSSPTRIYLSMEERWGDNIFNAGCIQYSVVVVLAESLAE